MLLIKMEMVLSTGTRTVEEGGDLVKIGQNTPDFYWGLNTQIMYKNFDIGLQFQGAQGGRCL